MMQMQKSIIRNANTQNNLNSKKSVSFLEPLARTKLDDIYDSDDAIILENRSFSSEDEWDEKYTNTNTAETESLSLPTSSTNHDSGSVQLQSSPISPPMGTPAKDDSGSVRRLVVKWNLQSTLLKDMISKIFVSHQFSDVTLRCEGISFPCHRLVLAASSPRFQEMLQSCEDNPIVHMKGMTVWEIRKLMTLVYIGEVVIPETKLEDFLSAIRDLNICGVGVEDNASEAEGEGEAETDNIVYTSRQPDEQKVPETTAAKRCVPMNEDSSESSQFVKRSKASVANTLIQDTMGKFHAYKTQSQAYACTPRGNEPRTLKAKKLRMSSTTTGARNKNTSNSIRMVPRPKFSNILGTVGALYADGGEEKILETLKRPDEENPHRRRRGSADQYRVAKSAPQHIVGLANSSQTQKCRGKGQKKQIPKISTEQAVQVRRFGGGAALEEEAGGSSPTITSATASISAASAMQNSTSTFASAIPNSEREAILQKAMKLAMTGVSVLQAAAQYNIPRTTLGNYMKRRGLSSQFRKAIARTQFQDGSIQYH